jgi:hypothetical protein
MDKVSSTQYTGFLDNYIRRTEKENKIDTKDTLEKMHKVQPIDAEEKTIGKHLDVYA